MSSRDKADARFGAFSEVRHIQMGTSILERGVRPLPTIPQFAGAKSGIPANGLYPALLLNCHSALPSCLMFGPKPWVTLITPTSALLPFARTDTGWVGFISHAPCYSSKFLLANPIINQEPSPPCWACADHGAKEIPGYGSFWSRMVGREQPSILSS